MKITRIGATGLLSFGGGAGRQGFSLVTGDTTVVIGPNGSGKSNLVSIVHLLAGVVAAQSERVVPIRPVLDRGATRLDEAGTQLRHYGVPEGEGIEARLGLELTTPAERELVTTFLRAALVSQLTTNNPNRRAEDYWPLVERIPDGAFEPFFRGELVASHAGIAGTYWRARFDLNDPVDGLQLVWDLWMNSGQLVRADATEARPLPDLWTKLGLASPMGQVTADQQEELPDMANFSFGALAADPRESWPTVLNLPGLRPEQLAPAVRRFLAMSGAQVPFGNASIGAAYVWDRLLRGGIRVLDIDAPLASRGDAGVFAGSWHYSADELAEPAGLSVRELPRRLWELHNGGPEGAMALQSVKDHFKAIASGRELCVGGRLVPGEAHKASTPLQLAVSNTPVGEMARFSQPAPVLAVPTASEQPSPERRFSLEVDLSVKTGPHRTESLVAAGSGVAQALVIAEALGGSQGRVTVLDEPAVNLHPEWQRLVREQVDRLATSGDDSPRRAQFVLITHGASLAAPTRATGARSVLPTRLILEDGVTRAICPPYEGSTTKWPIDLQLSPEPWALLFANGALLTEGATEVGALPIWFDKISHEDGEVDSKPWNARNVAIFSVGGHGAFGSWARFLRHYAVRFAVCCDGQVLDPCAAIKEDGVVGFVPNRHWVFKQLADANDEQLSSDTMALTPAGKTWGTHPDHPAFEDVRAAAANLGIFTVATWFQKVAVAPAPADISSPCESIDDLIDQDPKLSVTKKAITWGSQRRSDVRVGAYVAALCDPPSAVRRLYEQVVRWFD